MDQASKIKYSVVEGWSNYPKATFIVTSRASPSMVRTVYTYLFAVITVRIRPERQLPAVVGRGDFNTAPTELRRTERDDFCTDDGNHTVRQFTPEGKLLMTRAF